MPVDHTEPVAAWEVENIRHGLNGHQWSSPTSEPAQNMHREREDDGHPPRLRHPTESLHPRIHGHRLSHAGYAGGAHAGRHH